MTYQISMIAIMVFGFGFVVFFHEMGHFLAAKWVGIKVEQFAVGFGQALFAFRKGIGWMVGSTHKEYLRRIEEHLDKQQAAPVVPGAESPAEPKEKTAYTDDQIARAATELGLGDTEYRLNWIPLGGYVKMLGQDDLKPGAIAEDPRAYNRKSISQRMIVVSAGVIMNIILAAIGFMVVFLIGLNAPPAVVGGLLAGSPAQKAGLQAGDRILRMDGAEMQDFTKIALGTALGKEGEFVTIDYERPGVAGIQHTTIRPERMDPDPRAFLTIGIRQADSLRGVDPKVVSAAQFAKLAESGEALPDPSKIKPDETIIAINGQPVEVDQAYKLDEALQASDGRKVAVTVKDVKGETRIEEITPYLDHPFGGKSLNFAGLQPRPMVDHLMESSSVKDKLKPGDVIVALSMIDLQNHPDVELLKEVSNKAYEKDVKLTIYVLRDGQTKAIDGIEPKTRTDKAHHGLGIGLGFESAPVVSTVLADSPAKRAGIPDGARIDQVDGQAVSNWFQVRELLSKSEGPHTLAVSAPENKDPNVFADEPQSLVLNLSAADVQDLKNIRAGEELALREAFIIRKTTSPLLAARWGIIETRDFVLQFYVTIKRMFQGSVSYTNMMGPLGIVQAGAKFASKGPDWLIWFLAMISANLAVVNFLPIPIVDGGLFTFLLLEKIQGKPLSQRTQAVAQIVGFALIISVFLLVTFQDIRRTMGMN